MFPLPNDTYSSFHPFSPPTYGTIHDIISQRPQPPPLATAQSAPPPPPPPTRKDRHKKIYTAKGPRDRRMRLSLDVARKFFDLQDLLAFDKASKTVQWLLNKSKAAIKDHVAASKGKSSLSQCEECIKSPPVSTPKLSKTPVSGRKMRPDSSVKPRVARECRDKARARARERTLEKKKKKMQYCRQEMGEYCSINIASPAHQMENDGNGSIALFYYDDQAVENLLDDDSWEINLTENVDELLWG